MAAIDEPGKIQRTPVLSFAERLDELFRAVVDPHTGRLWSNRSVAAELTRRGHAVSHTHVGNLRTGRADPRRADMQALADLFGQRLSFFTDTPDDALSEDAAATEHRLRLALADPAIRQIALKMADARLSTLGAEAIVAMIEQVQRLEARRPGTASTESFHEQ